MACDWRQRRHLIHDEMRVFGDGAESPRRPAHQCYFHLIIGILVLLHFLQSYIGLHVGQVVKRGSQKPSHNKHICCEKAARKKYAHLAKHILTFFPRPKEPKAPL